MSDQESQESFDSAGTAYHAKYFAHALTLHGGENVDRIRQPLLNASVDLNPHQVQAALFALQSPLSKGVLLADEVGLGKTIEAGLVLCQLWAERRRRLLVICPASLRKQWQCELQEKFNLPAEVLDARRVRELQRDGSAAPFLISRILITSYHFAAKMKDSLRAVSWDCVVLDECHKLRNAYRESNRIGQALLWALEGRRKILLSATPLQNSLTELYGVAKLIDPELFGDLPSFRSRYANAGGDVAELRERLKGFCRRTLRRDVLEYVRYTKRLPVTTRFESSESEFSLYNDVSAYLQDETAYAFPRGQRHMLTLLVRKLLASSPAALAGTLEKILARLRGLQTNLADPEKKDDADALLERLLEGEEDLLESATEDVEDEETLEQTAVSASVPADAPIDAARLAREIARVENFADRARAAVGADSKTRKLAEALRDGFARLAELHAAQKAVVFTESRRSMLFLKEFLEANGYAGEVVCFSGGGRSDPAAEAIFQNYKADHPDDSASKPVMMRHALIEHFRTRAKILIATEAGAEGINLQFCSMVVNYDLPWNPQRVEQRIGRCHRYGQKFDVVVVNFLNTRNAADVRVFELLDEKLKLFDGVFGASNDVLGAVEQLGVSFENRIHAILQSCRSEQEIQASFDALKKECEEKIEAQRRETQKAIIENLDEEVVRRLRADFKEAQTCLDTHSRRFWMLTKHVLRERAEFDDATLSFTLREPPFPGIEPGLYTFSKKEDAAGTPYRPNSPLGECVIETAKALPTPFAEVDFDVSHHPTRITVLEQLKGRSGFLLLNRLSLKSLDAEDFLLFSAVTDDGAALDKEIAKLLFALAGVAVPADALPPPIAEKLAANAAQFAKATANKVGEKNNKTFQEQTLKLERWSDDQIAVATRKVAELKAQKREIERAVRQAENCDEQAVQQKKLGECRAAIRAARRRVEAVEDETDEKRNRLLDALQRKLVPATETETLFTVRWRVV